ncbi:serine hydrolase domain-containing protein [Brevundimonas sp. NPDC090276]|uniref:serine hydrolase domain-containing protein n=1 Tax=Brevundimonas sp. NPDC090276 TaxID=3363956 RepID=UPI00383B207E
MAGRVYPPATIEAQMQALKVPGVSIAFVDGGRIAWTRTYGLADPATGRRVDVDTLFQAASISKPVAAMVALDMVEDGLLSLDAPVNDRLSGWKIPDNELTARTPVTLRHLLSHTGGLTVGGFPGYAAGTELPTVEAILNGAAPANTAPVVVDLTPGQRQRYSGGGITIVQLLMSQAGATDFAELMQTRVLRPLGMSASAYAQPLPTAWEEHAATGHRADGAPTPGRFHTYPELAAAGLWTTSSDLARFVIGLNDSWAGRSEAVLQQATARVMLTEVRDGWGLGLMAAGQGRDLRYSHSGANDGFRAMLVGFPERDQGVVIMTNGDRGGVLIASLMQAVAAEYGWPGYEPTRITPVALSADRMAAYAGTYRSNEDALTVVVAPDGGALKVLSIVGEVAELVPEGPDRFIDTQRATVVSFLRDEVGRVSNVEIGGVVRARSIRD